MSQIERRYLVLGLEAGPSIRPETRSVTIEQGYWDSPEHDILRVRIVHHRGDGGRVTAEAVRKTGRGAVREPSVLPLEPAQARWWLDACPYRVTKERFFLDGWKLDVFERPLEGLIMAEIELPDEHHPVLYPPWLLEAREVTDQVNNLDLARLSRLVGGEGAAGRWLEAVSRKVPRIVLTGGPCSGKTTVMKALRARFGGRVHCVPEVATILIAQAGLSPALGGPWSRRFQQVVYATQTTLERAAEEQAAALGKRAVLQDRGTLDALAYLSGGETEFAEVCHADARIEGLRYGLVVQLAVPPREIYDANRANNPARSETYDQAAALDQLIAMAWQPHARVFRRVESAGAMGQKIDAVAALIEDFLAKT